MLVLVALADNAGVALADEDDLKTVFYMAEPIRRALY